MRPTVLAGLERTLRAVAETVVPETGSLDSAQWAEIQSIVEGALRARPPSAQRQLRLFLRGLDGLARLRWGSAFGRLDEGRREVLLRRLQDSRLLLFRRGAWGLRTLVLMGYYGRSGAAAEIGYRAAVDRGWPR